MTFFASQFLYSTQRLAPYYVLYYVFLTSLTEIDWVQEFKWIARKRLSAVREEENEWPLCEGSAYKQYCQSSQWNNWFCDKTNHNPIKRATVVRIKHLDMRLEIQMGLTCSHLLSFVGTFLLVSKSGRNSYTLFKISSSHSLAAELPSPQESSNLGLKK